MNISGLVILAKAITSTCLQTHINFVVWLALVHKSKDRYCADSASEEHLPFGCLSGVLRFAGAGEL